MNSGSGPGGFQVPVGYWGSSTDIVDGGFIGIDDPPSTWCSAGSSTSSKLGLSLEHIGLSEVEVHVLAEFDVDLQDTGSWNGGCNVGLGRHKLGVQSIHAIVGSGGKDWCCNCRLGRSYSSWYYWGDDSVNMSESGSGEHFSG